MPEVQPTQRSVIDAQAAARRWAQALDLFEFSFEACRSNPGLAERSGRHIHEWMLPIAEVQLRHADDLS